MITSTWNILATAQARPYLSDRKPFLYPFRPDHLLTIALTRFALVQSAHGTQLLDKYGGDEDALCAHQRAWLDPSHHAAPNFEINTCLQQIMGYSRAVIAGAGTGTILPSTASTVSEDNSEDENEDLVVESPWPKLCATVVHQTAKDVAILVVTWGLEEIATHCFTDKTCDQLTKNAYASDVRKIERNESKLNTTPQILITHLKASCLRWSAIFCVNTFTSLRQRWFSKGSDENPEPQNHLPSLPVVISKSFVNEALCWMIESCSNSCAVLLIPFKFHTKLHSYTYTMVSAAAFSTGLVVVRTPIIKALF